MRRTLRWSTLTPAQQQQATANIVLWGVALLAMVIVLAVSPDALNTVMLVWLAITGLVNVGMAWHGRRKR